MEDGTVSIFGLVFGVAATTTDSVTVLVAGASGAADPNALRDLMTALQAGPDGARNPLEQALWMLVADFLSAAVPILPFALLPIAHARIVSAAITILLLVGLGIGRARIGGRRIPRTVAETVAMGVAAAMAGVAIGVLINRSFGG